MSLSTTILLSLVVMVSAVLLHQRNRNRHLAFLQRERLLHEARLSAIEKGLEPDLSPAPLFPVEERRESLSEIVDKLARLAGFMLLAGGLGFFLGVTLVPETKQTLGLNELAPLGLVPAAVGLGLLMFTWFSGRK